MTVPTTDDLLDCPPGQECPVTVSVARKVKVGKEAEYEDWLRGVTAASRQFRGHQGSNVLRPSDATKGEYVIIYHFDTYAHAQAWEESAEREAWVARLPDLVEGEATRKHVTGLEFWFDLPSVPVAAKPVQYKMAMTLAVVVYSMVMLLSTILGPLIRDWPFWGKLLVVVPIQVTLMTYVVMPRVTQLLKHWLFR